LWCCGLKLNPGFWAVNCMFFTSIRAADIAWRYAAAAAAAAM
jgi:hypothetical protein